MAKTYIYGVPHGFDFYEKDAEFNDYFKGFYISSRRGRRLMINRRDNGETIYSYLRYGLKEIDRQPLHSFFGMSLVVDNYQFCPNFKVLLEWFEYLFNKLVNEHNIIKMNDDGVLHYVIHKFDENLNDVKWLKDNIPNILSQTQTENYDNSFICGKAGQVVNFNQPIGEKRLLETFKKYCWISVSSDILEKEDEIKPIIGDPGTIELNYEELNKKLNEFNQDIVPIAVDISKASYSDLTRMHNDVQEINSSLSKYLPIISDIDEKENFSILENKFISLKGSIETLLMKINGETKQDPPKTQYCFSCKQNKPLSEFRSPDSTKCIECEKRDVINDPYKTCISCGKKKPVQYFNQPEADICDDCVKKQRKSKPKPKSSNDDIWKVFKSKGFWGALISVILIVASTIVFLNLSNSCEAENSTARTENNNPEQKQSEDDNNLLVIREELDKLISDYDFNGISKYIEGKKDAGDYKSEIKNAIQQYLMSIIGKPQSSEELVLTELEQFFVDNISLLTFVDFEQNDQTYWEKFTSDYFYVWGLIQNSKISQTEKENGSKILSYYGNAFPADWSSLLEAKSVEKKERHVAVNDTKNATFITLSRFGSDGQTLMGSVQIRRGLTPEYEIGNYVELVSNDGTAIIVSTPKKGSFEENPRGKGNLRLKITGNPGDYTTYKCGSIVITIKAKAKQSKFHKH